MTASRRRASPVPVLRWGRRPAPPPQLALSGNTPPRGIAIEKLQQALKQQGAFIGRDQTVPEGV